ncbi:hypothetical protein QQY24_18755 [Streptomyces sp. TG1A-8]|uniref:hypothetical protein n=1 Tax=Streptomyces sp. TG1A-8 TaxID=3051385 RepID=UPI00265C51F5|nr:hypothetical protein [Streptomyces sp. TG1A-8]MDO0927350.1 hypothetical protein [Streptomyces sp. TG1A-8]
MRGHGYAPPVKQPPHTAVLVFLRVLFVAVGVCSIGFLTWVMLLRLAVVTRRSLDWGLFVAVLAADVLSIVLLGSESGEEIHTPGGYLGLFLLLGTLVAAGVYYLVVDVRHFGQRQRAHAAPGPAAYGYPGHAAAFAAPAVRSAHTGPAVPVPPAPHTPPPHARPPMAHTPVPRPPLTAPPQRPAPARIDQVRAELDELSDYLRKHEGHRDGQHDGRRDAGHEGGR